MGVPILCIIFGFHLDWYITKRLYLTAVHYRLLYSKILKLSILTSVFTFLLMIIIWGRTILMFFDPKTVFRNFGHPFILYDPKISFAGWTILMIFISPFLQLLTFVFASFLTLIKNTAKNNKMIYEMMSGFKIIFFYHRELTHDEAFSFEPVIFFVCYK